MELFSLKVFLTVATEKNFSRAAERLLRTQPAVSLSIQKLENEIGEKLFISPKTVETYKQRISEKLGITHRSDYVQICLQLGLLQAKT